MCGVDVTRWVIIFAMRPYWCALPLQVIFITEYMSSGSLKQFLKKTKKNHKTMNEKVWRKGRVLSWFGGLKKAYVSYEADQEGLEGAVKRVRGGLLMTLDRSLPGLEALVHTNPLCPKVSRIWLVFPVSPDLVPPNRFQSTVLPFGAASPHFL